MPSVLPVPRMVVAAASACVMAGCGAAVPSAERPVALGDGVTVDRAAREVRVRAAVACDRGWLEQAACRTGTRDHESLLSVEVPPSRIHAALLLIGLEPGAPGRWEQGADGGVRRVPPEGPSVELWVRTPAGDRPLDSWIHDPVHGARFPAQPWVFAGSRLLDPAKGTAGGRYAADRSGSLAGIVTFGDETIAFRDVLSDQAAVDAPQWQAATGSMPPSGTAVELIIRPGARR